MTEESTPSPSSMSQLTIQLREVTSMFQSKNDEWKALQLENAQLKEQQKNMLNTSPLASASSPSLLDLHRKLALRDDELSALRLKNDDLVHQCDKLESELVYHRKKYEHGLEKWNKEKQDEIDELKKMFNETLEKRKEAFLAVKEKLKQASVLLQQFQSQHVEQEMRVEQNRVGWENEKQHVQRLESQIAQLQQDLTSAQQQRDDYIKQLNELQQNNDKQQLLYQQQINECQTQIQEMKTRIAEEEEIEQLQHSPDFYLTSEGSSDVVENSRAIVLHHAFDSTFDIAWYRLFRGAQFTKIVGASSRTYIPTVDDIGATLKCELILGGNKRISREIGPVQPTKQMLTSIIDILKKQEACWNVQNANEQNRNEKEKIQIVLNKEKIKLRAGNKTIEKAVYNERLSVTLDPDNALRFTVRVEPNATHIAYVAANTRERDLIVQSIRSLNAHVLAEKTKLPDSTLALLYLIQTMNEKRALSQGDDGTMPHITRQRSISHSNSNTQNYPAMNSLDYDSASAQTPHRESDAGRNTPAISTASAHTRAGSITSGTPTAHKPPVAPKSAAKSSDADQKSAPVTTTNSDGLEVDEDGFIIRKDTGFTDYNAKDNEQNHGFTTDEDEEDGKPAIQMKINEEARPKASGDELRRSVIMIGLSAPGKDMKKDKDKKKSKKDKKKKGDKDDGDEKEPSASPASSQQDVDSNSSSNTAATATDAYKAAAASPSPPADSHSHTSSSTSTQHNSASADDIFAELDKQYNNSPPPLGHDSFTAKQQVTSPPPSSKPASSTLTSPLAVSDPAPPSPALTLQTSSSSQLSAPNVVDILVVETIHARVVNGKVIEYAVLGEVVLNVATAPTKDLPFDFQLFGAEYLTKVTPNPSVLTVLGGGQYTAVIPSGCNSPICVMQYKVDTEALQSKHPLPVTAIIQWDCAQKQTVIDVKYSLNPTSNLVLQDVKFLIAVQPERSIKTCQSAQPKCMWSPSSQKMMWQLPQIPRAENGKLEYSGVLHAELLNESGAVAQPSPLSLSFMSGDVDTVISGVLVSESDKTSKNHKSASFGRALYRLKSGIFTII